MQFQRQRQLAGGQAPKTNDLANGIQQFNLNDDKLNQPTENGPTSNLNRQDKPAGVGELQLLFKKQKKKF